MSNPHQFFTVRHPSQPYFTQWSGRFGLYSFVRNLSAKTRLSANVRTGFGVKSLILLGGIGITIQSSTNWATPAMPVIPTTYGIPHFGGKPFICILSTFCPHSMTHSHISFTINLAFTRYDVHYDFQKISSHLLSPTTTNSSQSDTLQVKSHIIINYPYKLMP